MALNNPVFGEGTLLKVSDGAANALTELDDYISLTPPPEQYTTVSRKVLRRNRTLSVVSPVLDIGPLTIVYEVNVTSRARYAALMNITKTWSLLYMDGLLMSFTGTMYMHTPGQIADGNAIITNTAVIVIQSLIAISTVTALSLPVVPASPAT
ncbi:hypothetical protein BH11PLA2_BH11PLA2_32860 [soil metagenome]